MSNNKQSSVYLFIQQLEQKGDLAYYESIKLVQLNIDKDEYLTLKEQAKAMHKEEMIESVKYGFNKEYYTPNYREQQELFEQYYNETFGGNNDN